VDADDPYSAPIPRVPIQPDPPPTAATYNQLTRNRNKQRKRAEAKAKKKAQAQQDQDELDSQALVGGATRFQRRTSLAGCRDVITVVWAPMSSSLEAATTG
jgi:hypothetical protein